MTTEHLEVTIKPGVFERRNPAANAIPVLFEIPRSGAEYPRSFRSPASLTDMQGSVSSFVETVYERIPEAGATWLYAKFPNAFIDLNRNEEDIDPGMVEGSWTGVMNPSARTAAGKGLLPMTVGASQPIYDGKIAADDLRDRIENFHRPYHAEVTRILTAFKSRFDRAVHLTCHSMPAIVSAGPEKGTVRSDFDLGDRNGTTASADLVAFLSEKLRSFGFDVTHNKFFAGAECVERHGRPDHGLHSIQIEMNRSLYMDEKARLLRPDVGKFQAMFWEIASALGSYR